jgi:hypothetical protein
MKRDRSTEDRTALVLSVLYAASILALASGLYQLGSILIAGDCKHIICP